MSEENVEVVRNASSSVNAFMRDELSSEASRELRSGDIAIARADGSHGRRIITDWVNEMPNWGVAP